MIINHVQLDWYTDKLRSGEPFALTKHSDASLYCMQGKEGGDCNGCDYTPELRKWLVHSVLYWVPGFHHGIQRLTDRDNAGFDRLRADLGIEDAVWIDTGILASQLRDGGLFPFFDALRRVKSLVVYTRYKLCDLQKLLPHISGIVRVPDSNTYDMRDELVGEAHRWPDGTVFLFSCGMAACAMVPQMHKMYQGRGFSFIDVGHIFDPFFGVMSRHYMTELTPARLAKNLWG